MRTHHSLSPDARHGRAPLPRTTHSTGRKIAGVLLAGSIGMGGLAACGKSEAAETPANEALPTITAPTEEPTISATQRVLPPTYYPDTVVPAPTIAPSRRPASPPTTRNTPPPATRPSLGGSNPEAVTGSPVNCTGFDITKATEAADGSYTVEVQPKVTTTAGATPNPAHILTVGQLLQRKGDTVSVIAVAGPGADGGLGAPITFRFDKKPTLAENTAVASLAMLDVTGLTSDKWPGAATTEEEFPLLAPRFNGRPVEPCGEIASFIALKNLEIDMSGIPAQ